MLERDAHIYAYQWHLVYLHTLNLSFVLYYRHIYERERSSENVITGPVLAIRKLLVIFMLFYMVLLNLKNHKNSGYSLCFILVL
jgi:hypothetical protein